MKTIGEIIWWGVVLFALTFCLVTCSLATEPPKLYLICADWCPPCQIQKKNMPKGTIFLDYASPEGQRLLTGGKIPQTIYIQGEKRWDKVGVFDVTKWLKTLPKQ